MRIAWYSVGPHGPSGYGQQTALMLERLAADGHEVAVLSNHGHRSGLRGWPTPSGAVIPVWPEGLARGSVDVVDDQARAHFGGERGLVVTLYDTWVLRKPPDDRFPWADQLVASWTPVDHYPVPREVLKWARAHRTIAMSRFGQQALAESGVSSDYIPHGIPPVFQPMERDRAALGLPEDAFVVLIVAANNGRNPCRKAFPEMLAAFAAFAADHPDAVLHLHTDPEHPNGYPIKWLLSHLGVPGRQVFLTDPLIYALGDTTQEQMAQRYAAADVLLATSMGEGFGLPVAESMATGTPAIVTDFSAQPEVVGETGWKVGYQRWFDTDAKAELATPSIAGIRDALEQAYEERGTENAAARSLAAQTHIRAEYDADTVYAEKWRPLLAELESELTPNRAQRRAKRKQ
jgi:glycosyltransferase involved in cell wall biosynthesis